MNLKYKAQKINNYFKNNKLDTKIRVNVSLIKDNTYTLPYELFSEKKQKWERIYKSKVSSTLKKFGISETKMLRTKNISEEIENTATIPKNVKEQLNVWRQWNSTVAEKGTKVSKYSPEDVKIARSYTGIGGLVAKYGELLKDEIGIDNMQGILDQFFTPHEVIKKMWALAFKFGFTFGNKHILEPSCGNGRFLEYIPENNHVLAFEPDINPFMASKISFPKFDIRNDVLETLFYKHKQIDMYIGPPKQKYDLVIGNPPYRPFVSTYKNEKKETLAETLDQYFIARGIDLLKVGGLLVFIVPSTFLQNNNKYNQFKKKIKSKSNLLEVYRLPNSIFPNTATGTDILVMQKII